MVVRKFVGKLLVMFGSFMTDIAYYVIVAGAWLMDREDVVKEWNS
jgi:hypothetical protein